MTAKKVWMVKAITKTYLLIMDNAYTFIDGFSESLTELNVTEPLIRSATDFMCRSLMVYELETLLMALL